MPQNPTLEEWCLLTLRLRIAGWSWSRSWMPASIMLSPVNRPLRLPSETRGATFERCGKREKATLNFP